MHASALRRKAHGAVCGPLLALWAFTVSLAGDLPSADHYVSKAGSNEPPYDTLETAAHDVADAIAVSAERSWIAVAEGVYDGNIAVTGRRVVLGEGAGRSVIRGKPGPDWSPAVTLSDSARLEGFTLDGNGCPATVDCPGGSPTIARCEVRGGFYNGVRVGASAPRIESCSIRANGWGGVRCASGSVILTDCVISGNTIGVVGLDGALSSVTHCTVVGNLYAGIESVEGDFVVRESILWGNGNDIEHVPPWQVVNSDVGNPDLSGFNGNIRAEPLFVGWGNFNDSDNAIHVDASHAGPEHGTQANPFRTIRGALEVYDFHLALGSPCAGAASDGRNMGAFPDDTPVRPPGSGPATVRVAPGIYRESQLPLFGGVHLEGPGPHLATLAPSNRQAAWLRSSSTIEGFSVVVNEADAILITSGSDSTISRCVITTSPLAPGRRGGVGIGCAGGRVTDCLIYGMRIAISGPAILTNCTITDNTEEPFVFDPTGPPLITNSIVWANGTDKLALPLQNVRYSLVSDSSFSGRNGNIHADPGFLDPSNGDFRLLPDSPCIDAGFNNPELPETDIAGMHRIMFGGKSLTVDMGAYEFYINDLTRGPNPEQTTFTWSSLAEKTYSIFCSSDLLTWHLAMATFPSSGNQTTSWIDDGTTTGVPPSLVPRRFYRTLENP